MNRLKAVSCCGLLFASMFALVAPRVRAQSPDGVDTFVPSDLLSRLDALTEKAKANKDGIAGVTLGKYSGSLTLLIVRVKDGQPELHDGFADYVMPLRGAVKVTVGGQMADAHEVSAGEVRGSALHGGQDHVIPAGALFHIPAGVPHQTLVEPGRSCAYIVIKAAEKMPSGE